MSEVYYCDTQLTATCCDRAQNDCLNIDYKKTEHFHDKITLQKIRVIEVFSRMLHMFGTYSEESKRGCLENFALGKS